MLLSQLNQSTIGICFLILLREFREELCVVSHNLTREFNSEYATAQAFSASVLQLSMRLTENMQAPDFSTTTLDGTEIALSEFRGQRLMLSFYRYASCPLCNMRVSQLTQLMQKHNIRAPFLGVFQSPPETMKKHVGKQKTPIQLLPDPERKLYRLYGVETSLWGLVKGALKFWMFVKAALRGFLIKRKDNEFSRIPADFLINEDGTIHTTYYGNDIGDHLDIEIVKDFFTSEPLA